MADQLEKVQRIVEENGCDPRHLIAILQGIQAENNYLSEEALRLVAEKIGCQHCQGIQRGNLL